jgi:sulfur carrier protein ThiS
MITVDAKLFATLRRVRPDVPLGQPCSVALAEAATVADLINELGLPEEEVKLVFVNGRSCKMDHVLSEGDEIGLFPPVGGG